MVSFPNDGGGVLAQHAAAVAAKAAVSGKGGGSAGWVRECGGNKTD